MTHDAQPEERPRGRTRRDLLIGSGGALAALAVGSTQPAQAINGDVLKLGNSNNTTNTASSTTELDTTAPIGLFVTAAAGTGIEGKSTSGGDGVHGEGFDGVSGVGL